MNDPEHPPADGLAVRRVDDPADVVIDMLEAWEAAYDRGVEVAPESLCRDHPELTGLVRDRIALQRRLREFLKLEAASAVAPDDALPTFPGFETLAEVGRGGMGVVYKARELALGRVVAIKTISEAGGGGARRSERFLIEARAVARLRHPHIIPIHAIGEHQGRPYFTLEFAQGGDLADRLEDKVLTPRAAAVLVETLATAVQYAHEQGVVHRDIKPRNVLLTAEGVPKLTDFGLARLLDADSTLTAPGQPIGTPSYMAPEVARGDSSRAGPEVDVYALGTILYQAVVGRPPFLAPSTLETLRLVVSTDADPPRRLRRDVPRDVETIILKCLEKEPGRRYATAADLAADLGRYLAGRSIAARRASVVERSARWCRRNPWIAAAGTILVVGAGLSSWQALRATRAERAAVAAGDSFRRERDRAKLSRDNAVRAVQNLLDTKGVPVVTEEIRGYRKLLLAAGVGVLTDLVEQLEDDAQAESLRVGAHLALAKVQVESGNVEAARETANRAVALAEVLTGRDPSSSLFLRDLASAYQQLAMILAYSDRAASIDRLDRSISIGEALIDGHRDDPDLFKFQAMNRYSLAVNRFVLGLAESPPHAPETAKALVSLEKAEEAIAAALEVAKDRDPILAEAARVHTLMIPINHRLGRIEVAARMGARAIEEYREIAARNPSDFTAANQLSGAQRELGYFLIERGRADEAISHNRAACETLREMIRRFDASPSLQVTAKTQLAVLDNNLIDAYAIERPKYLREIRLATAEALELSKGVLSVVPRSRELKFVHAEMTDKTAYYRELDGNPPDLATLLAVERLWDELRAGDASDQVGQLGRVKLGIVRLRIADIHEGRGDRDEARRRRLAALEAAGGDPEVEFQMASGLADDAWLEARLPATSDRGRVEIHRSRCVGHAVMMLDRAIDHGLRDPGRIEADRALANVLAWPEFRAVADRLRDSTFPDDPFARP